MRHGRISGVRSYLSCCVRPSDSGGSPASAGSYRPFAYGPIAANAAPTLLRRFVGAALAAMDLPAGAGEFVKPASRVGFRPRRPKQKKGPRWGPFFGLVGEWTGLEPATPGVTGRYSNQLNYHSVSWWVLTGSNRRPSPCKGDALPAELSTQSVRISRASTRLCEVCGQTAISLQQRLRKTVLNQAVFRPPAEGRASLRHPSGLCQP
jgi:hypothetical protein